MVSVEDEQHARQICENSLYVIKTDMLSYASIGVIMTDVREQITCDKH